MKKLLSLLLALSMLLTGVAFAEDDLTGEWYADFLGMTMMLTLYDDATYQMDFAGDLNSGAWVLEGDTLIFDQGTDAEMNMQYDASAPSLLMNLEGMEFLFTREAPETYTPATPVADAAAESFEGCWATKWISMFDMMLDPVASGNVSLYFIISGTDVTLISDDGFSGAESEMITGVYENGTLTITEPAADEYSEDTTFVIRLLEDGMLSCEADMLGETIVFYLAACEEWELPSLEPAAPAEPADPSQLLGTWYEEDYTLTLNEDGTAQMEHSLWGTEELHWESTANGAVFTDGTWADSDIVLSEDGSLIVSYWLYFSREPYVAPDPYDITLILGDWEESDGSKFIVSDDFTAVYKAADGSEMTMEWENGELPVITTGDWWLGTMEVNEEGILVVDDGFTHKEFSRPEPVEEPVDPEIPAGEVSAVSITDPATYLEKNFVCVQLVQDGTAMDMAYVPVSSVVFHENGMADVTIMGMLQENQPYTTGNMGGVDTFMVTYMDYLQLLYNVGETGLDLNYMDVMDMHFEVK